MTQDQSTWELGVAWAMRELSWNSCPHFTSLSTWALFDGYHSFQLFLQSYGVYASPPKSSLDIMFL
jgi:hypothetical protein